MAVNAHQKHRDGRRQGNGSTSTAAAAYKRALFSYVAITCFSRHPSNLVLNQYRVLGNPYKQLCTRRHDLSHIHGLACRHLLLLVPL